MNSRPSFFHLVHSLNPIEGGVSSAVLALNDAIIKAGRKSFICTSPGELLEHKLNEKVILIAHGLWHWPTREVVTHKKNAGHPYLIFPHGMLDPWFKKTYPLKHVKKQIYWWLQEGKAIRDSTALCFTTKEEQELAKNTFIPYKCKSEVVGLGVEQPKPEDLNITQKLQEKFKILKNKKILLFLGRVHPKKGLDLLVDSWIQKCPTDGILVIAGPLEEKNEYLMSLQKRTQQFHEKFLWTGMLEGDQKWSMLRMADALILPSHQENFGMVVAEALAVGTPVYLTDKVNLWREVIESNAGYVDSDDQPGINRLVDKWKTKDHQQMIPNTISCFQEKLHIKQTAQKIISMFESSKVVKATNLE